MKRLARLIQINPIIIKETRSRMRGPRAFITLTALLLFMGGVMFGVLQLIMAGARYSNVLSPQIGQVLFAALAFLLLFMISAVTPAVTSGAISGEKEKQTYEMLVATPLSGASILWGKLISSLSYVFLLLFAAIPLASVVFIFGGVSLREMFKSLALLIFIAVAFGILGLFYSALLGRTGRATIASFLTVLFLMLGPLFLAAIIGTVKQAEPPRMVMMPSPISALSSTLAPTIGMNAGGSLFYILGGVFNMGSAPISQTSIPRPMYHYTVPFYALLSLILYLLATRLVQPTRRWKIQRKELLSGLAVVAATAALIAAAFYATAPRYVWAVNPQAAIPGLTEPILAQPVFGQAEAREVVVVGDGTPTPTPTAGEANHAALDENDQSQIYAAVARQLFIVDNTFGGQPPKWELLFLMSITDDSSGDPSKTNGESLSIPDAVQLAVSENLSDLPAKVLWAKSRQEINIDENTGVVQEGRGAIITFGNFLVQEDGSVQVPASIYFGNLGAGGKTYILALQDGVWSIIGTIGVEWMS